MDLERGCLLEQEEQFCLAEDAKVEKKSQDKEKSKVVTIGKRKDFKRVYSRGKCNFSSNLVLYFWKGYLKQARLGVSASKKVGCAVKRNRARRLVKEAWRNLNVDLWGDFVIVVKPSILELKMQDVKKEISDILAKIERRKKSGKIFSKTD